uniref:HMG box domain-containing protein n=1 Tax=Panagrolaimus sp. ES5 TaxID=591445 RepID=A0AC34GHT7_9BILA
MYNALMQNMRNLATFNQNNNNNQMPSFDIKPTTSSAISHHGHGGHSLPSGGAGGPISTPKRKKINHKKEESHIKKPLNAFMWFMKENRQKVLNVDGNASKQSAELNTILGKMWHDLPKDEQQKYYEKAKEERENHQKLYPNWSARENYAVHKKKRKKREKSVVSSVV